MTMSAADLDPTPTQGILEAIALAADAVRDPECPLDRQRLLARDALSPVLAMRGYRVDCMAASRWAGRGWAVEIDDDLALVCYCVRFGRAETDPIDVVAVTPTDAVEIALALLDRSVDLGLAIAMATTPEPVEHVFTPPAVGVPA